MYNTILLLIRQLRGPVMGATPTVSLIFKRLTRIQELERRFNPPPPQL